MIQYDPQSWLRIIFHSYSRYVLKSLYPLFLAVGGFSLLLVFLFLEVFDYRVSISPEVHSILGIILGLFLVLRTNTSYDRWWEGRILWGQLVNNCRNAAIRLNSFLIEAKLQGDDRAFFSRMIGNLPFVIKEHLRDGRNLDELEIDGDEQRDLFSKADNLPNLVSLEIYKRVESLRKRGALQESHLFVVDKEFKGIIDVLGGCERIKSTPLPYNYNMFIKKFLIVYSISLPISLVSTFHYWTVPVVLVIFYFLVSLELIAEEIEDPFGLHPNDLPLEEISAKIRMNVKEILLGT